MLTKGTTHSPKHGHDMEHMRTSLNTITSTWHDTLYLITILRYKCIHELFNCKAIILYGPMIYYWGGGNLNDPQRQIFSTEGETIQHHIGCLSGRFLMHEDTRL